MSVLQSIVLGIVQGLTEFLPISSSGHLVIGQTLAGLEEPQLAFDVLVHGATLLAIIVYFRSRLIEIVRQRDVQYVAKLCVATLPIVAVALTLSDAIERAFGSPLLVAGLLAVTGTVLLSLYRLPPDRPSAAPPSWKAAIIIGCAQAVAVLPGISRSGMTITAGLWLGVAPAAAAEFAFLLGIPAIAGAVVYQAGAMGDAVGQGHAAPMILGSLTAFAAGLLAIAVVFRLLVKREFRRFGFYCWGIAVAFALYLST